MPIFVPVRESCFILEFVRADVQIKLMRETRVEQPVVRQDVGVGRILPLRSGGSFVVLLAAYTF